MPLTLPGFPPLILRISKLYSTVCGSRHSVPSVEDVLYPMEWSYRMGYGNNAVVRFVDVSFTYEQLTAPLFEGLNLTLDRGWTGLVGANGSGKTTFLMLASGFLVPANGHVLAPGRSVYCPQRTDTPPAYLADLIASTDGISWHYKNRYGIRDDWYERWDTLSHGERKRAQIGGALWLEPDVLAVDEPGNHLDSEALERFGEALADYSGCGLLVSHDRDMLDRVCGQCLFFDPPSVRLRPGGYTDGREQADREESHIRTERQALDMKYAQLSRTASQWREESRHADKRLSKRHLAKGDNDGRAKMNGARLTGKDAIAGRQLNRLEGHLKRVREKRKSLFVKREGRHDISLDTEVYHDEVMFHLKEGTLAVGGGMVLRVNDLIMHRTDRIGITGLNGSGKSTLINHIAGMLEGTRVRTLFMPQEITPPDALRIVEEARHLTPERLGRVMAVVQRLDSDPRRVLETTEPSPGELRKLFFALGLSESPHLIIMDEPTNHLDIVSVASLEDALASCRCGILLVSHDRRFLGRLIERRWHIDMQGGERRLYEAD